MIREFQGDERWLSNFAPCSIKREGFIFPSVEHAYMAAKSAKGSWKKFCANEANAAGQVKRASRNIDLVENWDTLKLEVMEDCVRQKFNQEPHKAKLLSTGKQHIQEGNRWGDKFWGVCLKTNKGENHLGRLIMQIRDELTR
tara:strand:+ start:10256 stop:10681 length:426 start_codon:yes stop_codon:yes gene_type:complete